jgi:hypothetical protein
MDPTVRRFRGRLLLGLTLALIVGSVEAGKQDCGELRSKIEAKLRSRGVGGFSLEIVEAGKAGGGRVVGTCDHDTHRIVYRRDRGKPDPDASAAGSAPEGEQAKAAKKKKKKDKPRTSPQDTPAAVPPIGNY